MLPADTISRLKIMFIYIRNVTIYGCDVLTTDSRPC